ncbi:MAG TPA: nuclear transport factor 2 family protein [Bacteroidales bacterium]|nr:nuclear transport factor 2 family protein [Bacteroidales bacterium]HPE56625.1 nuclear transport factor 2 family protein [Bacteroidales bacterium]
MKTIKTLLFLFAFLPVMTFAQDDSDEAAIKQVIQSAYVDGLQNKGPVEDIEAGFHPGFELLGVRNDELTKWPIYSWIQYHENKLEEDPTPPTAEEKVTCEFPLIDVTGTAAIAKIELYRGGEKIYTDYLSLYKFEEGWEIVSKIYFKHPKE